ncbi:hypothetical protein CC86DRAFT_48799 [Ophiobolus disseminans]|uniref:Uncharacterized protein n=1 Tax=Ophiobolus disseminans TaxID=1469910 RepID=A0A6A6ZV34_9PLEO|nr:hypothetical protein CC86DRAFT_48799 [Ophiobolus disseminans]
MRRHKQFQSRPQDSGFADVRITNSAQLGEHRIELEVMWLEIRACITGNEDEVKSDPSVSLGHAAPDPFLLATALNRGMVLRDGSAQQSAAAAVDSSLRCHRQRTCSKGDSSPTLSGRRLHHPSALYRSPSEPLSQCSASHRARMKHTSNHTSPVPPRRNHPCARFTQSIGTCHASRSVPSCPRVA